VIIGLIGAWLTEARITHGPVFRAVGPRDEILNDALSTAAIRATIKRAALKIGVNPAGFGGRRRRVPGTDETVRPVDGGKTSACPPRYTENIAMERSAMAALATQGCHKPLD
jgi:hypothetical protein